MDAITYLTSISLFFLVGILSTILSKRLRIPNVILLVLAGFLIKLLAKSDIIYLPSLFITLTSLIALALIIFDSASRFKFKEFDTFSLRGLKLFTIFLSLCLLLLTPLTMLLFNFSLMPALIFSILMSATAFEVLSVMLKKHNFKVVELLNLESILNAPFTVLLPFMVFDFMKNTNFTTFFSSFDFIDYVIPFLQQFITGVGAGVFVGVLIFKFMRKHYAENLSAIALITAVLLTYVLAEQLQGSGVLAVVVLGLFFGNVYVKKKPVLQEFSNMLASALEIIIFLLFGFIMAIPKNYYFVLTSIILFIIYLFIRLLAVELTVPHYSSREKIFATLMMPKGITLVVVALTFSTFNIQELNYMLELVFLFFVYSLVVSTVAVKYSKKFLGKENTTTAPDNLNVGIIADTRKHSGRSSTGSVVVKEKKRKSK